jgi:hypothetical protein
MKHSFTLSLLLLFCLAATAQQEQQLLHCATDRAMQAVYAKYPEKLKQKKQLLNQSLLQASRTSTVPNSTYVIPVVFHIMHLDGPENISDAQVLDGLRILNRDFAKQNADMSEVIPTFQGLADSTKIQFALPTRDPMGNCTNGIIHHYSTDADWDETTSMTLYSYTWDPTMYMNVYIVKSITLSSGFGAAGYTYYPGTWFAGDPFDAIVVLNNYFGSIGTGTNFLSRVLTHEVGHWLDLAHIFGYFQTAGIDCSDDDFVMDTPPTIGYLSCPNPAVPAQYQTCTPGVSENFQNYMDYSYCCRMFTTGQCQRMQQALQDPLVGRSNLWTNSNLIATGVINPTVPCVPTADFKSNRIRACVGTPVTYIDASWNGTPTAYNWTFNGGSPAVSTASAPVVTYASPGLYSVTYSSSNSAGNSAPVTKTSYINVTSATMPAIGSWTEGFENQAVFNTDWIKNSTSGTGLWERTGLAFYTGANSARISRLNNTRQNISSMTGPGINLSTIANPVLSFKVAAAESVPNHINALKVYASTNCGASWTVIYNKISPQLITTVATPSNFIPGNPNDWRTEMVSLAALSSTASLNLVQFKFEYTRDTMPSGNNIYVEDINISSITSLSAEQTGQLQELSLFPNPSSGDLSVSFSLLTAQKIKFVLLDVLGREMGTLAEKEFGAGNMTQPLELKEIPPGVYFLKIEGNGVIYTRKLLKE